MYTVPLRPSTGLWSKTYREEVFSAYLFDSLDEVRDTTAEWIDRYNEIRPHDALGSLPPARYREQLLAADHLAPCAERLCAGRTVDAESDGTFTAQPEK